MTATLNELLGSIVPEERRGRPGKARELALAGAAHDPAHRAENLLWAVYASLAIGEAREALRLLDTIPAGANQAIARRVQACRCWAQALDRNWYPGDIGGEMPPDWKEGLVSIDSVAPGDPETMLIEACAAFAPRMIHTFRNLVLDTARLTPELVGQPLQFGLQSLDSFQAIAANVQAWSAAGWALAAKADLMWRAGRRDEARPALAQVRKIHAAAGDAVGVADTWIIEGDCWAAPWSSPESLGLVLAASGPPATPPAPDHDAARQAYLQAAAALAQADAPRASAAVELRLTYMAGLVGDAAAQREHLALCERGCRDAGDAAGVHLATVHGWIVDIGRGDFVAVRRIAPLEWGEPHGPVAELAAWAATRGSLTWCTGLGRLLQRCGETWAAAREFERAELAYRLAAHLVPLSGAVPRWTILEALATLDERRNLTTRALVRRLQTLEALPLPRPPSADDPSWLQNLQLTLGLMSIPSGVIGAGDIAIRLIERGEERVNALMQAAGVPGADDTAVANDPRQALDTFKTAWGADIAAKLRGLPGGASAADALFPAVGAALARETLLRARPMVALLRARQAERLGWDSTADQWYRTSLEHSAKAGAANRWLEILILHSWGKRAQAQAALQRAVQERLVPDHQLAALAVRLRDYATARTLFASLAAPEGGDWRDAADRAEVALENGDGAAALALVSGAIATFESFVDHLARDADRVSACDDVNAAALYLLASRIHLRLAQGNGAAERARAFEVVDRHRALALPPDVPRAKAEALRQWQQAATEHATAYQRLLAALTLGTGDVPALRDTLAGAERALADIEAQLTPEQQIAVALARRVRAFTAQDAQRLLPANACLIEYQVVARDYIIFAVTGTQLVAHEGRLEHGTFEGMASRFVRACATGAPSPEAEDLAAVLLAPFGEILARHERVIIVPSGALNAVPFHVLPLQGKPLGETHVVSYLPAATLLLRGAVDRPLAAGGTLVVGDPAFDPTTHPSLKRLAGAAVEAKAVAQVHDTRDTYVGAQATEATLRPLLRDRALLHFAAHGRLDDIAPNTSSIVLAGNDELTVSDLIGLDIGADLTVLSACDTGRGTTTMGGDLVGLVRGLLAAGVRRCVVSLWPVDDVAACVTMAAFHRRARHGIAPAVALALAQREIRALTGSEIAERYRAMGGTLAAGDRALRRKGGSAVRLSAFPEVDTVEDIPVEAEDGQRTSIWAPFVLIGV